jgi:hypothetical protein
MSKSGKSMRFVVDRREGAHLVLESEQHACHDVQATKLPTQCRREGAVLDVPLDEKGNPIWKQASRNHAEELRRLQVAAAQLERLRRSDPGGDVEL